MNRKEAIEQGLKKYDGKICKNCGSTERFVSSYDCVICATERTLKRDPEVYKRYIKSEKGQDWIKEYRRSPAFRATQNRWNAISGFQREIQARRRKQIIDSISILTEEEFTRVKLIYREAAQLTQQTGAMHHVDHIIPLFEGGIHHPDNLQILKEKQHHIKCAEENKRRLSCV